MSQSRILAIAIALCALGLAGCATPATRASEPEATTPPGQTDSAALAAAAPSPTTAPTSEPPTSTPAPAAVPEPVDYAIADGGHFFARTGHAVRDESNGPRFWSDLPRLGGTDTLGLPLSAPFTIPNGARVQVFERGWIWAAPGDRAVQPGDAETPPIPSDAKAREDPPAMAFVGRVDVLPRQVRPGTTVLLKVWAPTARSVSVTAEGRTSALARDGAAFAGFIGFPRTERPGTRPLQFTLVDSAGRRVVRSDPADTIQLIDPQYPVEYLTLTQDTVALLDPALVNNEEALMNRVFSQWTPERLWHGPFAGPLGPAGSHRITSEFGVRRSINGGPIDWGHEGTDFAAPTGAAVTAAANGRVVFAGPLKVRGNAIVIDHGWGVMTGYYHLSAIGVEVGQMVQRSELIGYSGSTGLATGPHLHLDVRVQNVNVEPFEWLDWAPFQRDDIAAFG